MKINPIIKKLESAKIKNTTKQNCTSNAAKNNFISVIYYDIEKENIRLQQFTGVCTKFKSRGLNTKIYMKNFFKNITIDQQFFLYSPFVLDFSILRKNK